MADLSPYTGIGGTLPSTSRRGGEGTFGAPSPTNFNPLDPLGYGTNTSTTSSGRRGGGGTFGTPSITYTEYTDANGTVWRIGKNAAGEQVSAEIVGQAEATSSGSSGSSGWGSSGGGGGGGGELTSGVRSLFQLYAGYVPGVSGDQAWTEQDVINWCISNGAEGFGMERLRSDIRRASAPFYDDDPTAISNTMVDNLLQKGYWQDTDYLVEVYFPSLQGVGATNPLAAGYMDVWDGMVGNRPPGTAALNKLNEIINSYGFSQEGLVVWEAFLKTTESAYFGEFGAQTRASITDTISGLLGRNPTQAELTYGSPLWEMASGGSTAALEEYIMQSPEGKAIYSNKPAWMSPGEYVANMRGIDATLRWYYGDNVMVGDDGSVTFHTGAPDLANPLTVSTGVPNIPDYVRETAAPEWKSLNNAQWTSDLAGHGITFDGSTYTKDGQTISADDVLGLLPANTYYRDESGFHYVQETGAIDPRTGKATTGPTVPRASTTTGAPAAPFSGAPSVTASWGNLGVKYGSVAEAIMAEDPTMTADRLGQMFAWQEEADYMSGIYGDTLTEAFGSDAGIDWYKMASGAKGSGAMRAQIVEAQNRVAYRETYRQLFGTDPSPSDYDRITQEFVSPGEMLREHQAIESADEMYEEVNDLLSRVYGNGVSKDELKDMVLGRTNSGELKALINEATKLDQYTWIHKQYYDGQMPTPADYAKYAGFTGPAELQWEIVTQETVAEMRDTVNEAMLKAGYEPFSDEELTTMYGEQQGYGDLRSKYRDAAEKAKEVDQAEDWMYSGAEMVDIGYKASGQGGFQTSVPGLADL